MTHDACEGRKVSGGLAATYELKSRYETVRHNHGYLIGKQITGCLLRTGRCGQFVTTNQIWQEICQPNTLKTLNIHAALAHFRAWICRAETCALTFSSSKASV